MRHFTLIIFVVALVFILANTYIISRGWQLLEAVGKYRWVYVSLMTALAAMFVLGMVVKSVADSAAADTVWRIGAWWIVVALYSLPAVVCFDLLRLTLLVFGKTLSGMYVHYAHIKLVLFALYTIALLVVAGVGCYNGTHARVKTLTWRVHKKMPLGSRLNIVAISDAHLGAIYSTRALQRWITQINALQPDIVFLVGDTFDDNPAPVIRNNLGALFERIHAPLGVFAVTGNHELMRHPERAMNYLAQHGVQPLIDTAVLVANSFYVVGRNDRSAKERKTVAELTAGLNPLLPVIVLDHQPYEWDTVAAAGVDICLSGHTHHGQLFPLNLITQRMYEQDWGYLLKGDTHFYTSCGVGAWGAPVRTGSRSEVVQLCVAFE